MIESLKYHWPDRKMEWLMSGFMMSWGLYVLIHPVLFINPPTAYVMAPLARESLFFTLHPAQSWGGLFFAVGLVRGLALLVNGAWRRTPVLRLLAGMISMFVITQIIVGYWVSGIPNVGIVVYPWFVLMDLLSVYRAAIDTAHAWKKRIISVRALNESGKQQPAPGAGQH